MVLQREGEIDPSLKESGKSQSKLDFDQKREERKDLADLANKQWGVDALKGQFPGASPLPPPGVRDVLDRQED